VSVNFFCASCFAALGVIVPDLTDVVRGGDNSWPAGFEPRA